MVNKYVVVKERNLDYQGGSYNFTRFHDAIEEAYVEAERLCRKENHPFLVLQVIAKCSIGDLPVKWEK